MTCKEVSDMLNHPYITVYERVKEILESIV